MTHLNPTLRGQLASLTDEGLFELLGELLEPSVKSPVMFDDEDIYEELHDTIKAYQNAYENVRRILDGEVERDRVADEADYRYEEMRDRRMMEQWDAERAA